MSSVKKKKGHFDLENIFERGTDVDVHYSPTMHCMMEIEELNKMTCIIVGDETAPEKSCKT